MSSLTLFEKLFPTAIFKQHEGDDAFKAILISEVSIVGKDNVVSEKYIFILFFLAAHWLSSGLRWWKIFLFFWLRETNCEIFIFLKGEAN